MSDLLDHVSISPEYTRRERYSYTTPLPWQIWSINGFDILSPVVVPNASPIAINSASPSEYGSSTINVEATRRVTESSSPRIHRTTADKQKMNRRGK
jgi:hypothetical protein